MKLQLLSDLHLESESFDPVPAPGAELLVLAGDIDSTGACSWIEENSTLDDAPKPLGTRMYASGM